MRDQLRYVIKMPKLPPLETAPPVKPSNAFLVKARSLAYKPQPGGVVAGDEKKEDLPVENKEDPAMVSVT